MTDEKKVYPAPEEGGKSPVLKVGPWMDGSIKPTIDGMYLRRFDEGDGLSWWFNDCWNTDSFFGGESDIQDAPWKGGVLRKGKTHADWLKEHGNG